MNKSFIAAQGEQEEKQYYEGMHQGDCKIQDDMQELLAYLSGFDPDTMYFDQAMKHTNHKEFLNATIIAVKIHSQLKQ